MIISIKKLKGDFYKIKTDKEYQYIHKNDLSTYLQQLIGKDIIT